MRNLILIGVVCSALGVASCTTAEQGAAVGGAIIGAGVGALAGAVLVESKRGWCTYRYHGRLYRERCR